MKKPSRHPSLAFPAAVITACLTLALPPSPLSGQEPRADGIIVESRANPLILLKDLATGRLDILADPVEPADIAALPAEERARLLVAPIPSLSWSLLLNPAVDRGAGAAPGVIRGSDGKERFNPFGIPALRRAFSRLLDRRRIVDELCREGGMPQLTMVRPDAPGAAPWYRAVAGTGLRERGDPGAAAEITAALEAAAAHPAMRGRLTRGPGGWSFDAEPVRLKVLIRVDDPKGRLPLGRHVAGLLEPLGLAVERLEYSRALCFATMNDSDPADLAWSLYTEGWGAGAATLWHEEEFLQMYCPSYGNMPGAGRGERWKYLNPALDALGQELFDGRHASREAHEAAAAAAMRLALEESVRIFVASRDMAIAANRDRLGSMPLYDLVAGFGPWTWRSALPAPGPDGKRILRIGVRENMGGSPFSSAWDPLGIMGFSRPFQRVVLEACHDPVELPDPAAGVPLARGYRLAEWKAEPAGLPVPPTALVWDGGAKTWRKVAGEQRATARLVYDYARLPWQDGRNFGLAEVFFELGRLLDWSREDGPGDPAWDPELEAVSGPWLAPLVAVEILGPSRLAVYGDAVWLWDLDRLRNSLAVGGGPVPWPVAEALLSLVLRGGASGTRYALTPHDEALAEVDLAAPGPFADLVAELDRLAAEGRVPSYLAGIAGPEEVAAARAAALGFARGRGHLLDSNGPFQVERVHPEAGAVELVPFRPWSPAPGPTPASLARTIARIDLFDPPPTISGKAGAELSCSVSAVAYPEGRARAAGAELKATLILSGPAGERRVAFVPEGQGRFRARLGPAELAGLPPGAYGLTMEARIGSGLPDLRQVTILLLP